MPATMNFVTASSQNGSHMLGTVPLELAGRYGRALEERRGKNVIVGFRPEDLELNGATGSGAVRIPARVDVVEYLGHEELLHLESGGKEIIALVPSDKRVQVGDAVEFAIDAEKLHLFDPETEERIEQPVSAEAERETRLTPTEAVAQMRLNVPVRGNRKLRRILERVNADDQLKGWWHVANVNAVARLRINDHSWVHIQIVANIALKLLRQLTKHHVEPSVVTDYGYERDDAEVVVLLAALTHCVGMAVHRDGHEDFSLFLAEPKLRELLEGIYDEPDLTVIVSEVLQAITSHRDYGKPLTLEAGIVRVADALDMEQGRSRIPFARGSISIHSLSAAAIEDVAIKDGEERPILIEITMNNSSGIYQVDGLLKAKLQGSGLEPYVEVVAHIDTEAEKKLVPIYRLET